MKKYIKLTLFLLIITFIITPNKSYAKNKINVTVNNKKAQKIIYAVSNQNIHIKVNCKNFKYVLKNEYSDDVCKHIKGNSFNLKLKLKKNEEHKSYDLYIIKKGFSRKLQYIDICKFKNENQYKKSIKGLSKKYKNFLKYPYLKIKDKSFLKNTNFKKSLQLQWDMLPSYIKDSMVKTKYKIYIHNKKYRYVCISYGYYIGDDFKDAFCETLELKNENSYSNLLFDFGFLCYSNALYYYCYDAYYKYQSDFKKKDYKEIGWPYYSKEMPAEKSDFYTAIAIKVNYVKNNKVVDNKRIFECIWNSTKITKVNGYYCFYYNYDSLYQKYKENYYINGQNTVYFDQELKKYLIGHIKEKYKDATDDNIFIPTIDFK